MFLNKQGGNLQRRIRLQSSDQVIWWSRCRPFFAASASPRLRIPLLSRELIELILYDARLALQITSDKHTGGLSSSNDAHTNNQPFVTFNLLCKFILKIMGKNNIFPRLGIFSANFGDLTFFRQRTIWISKLKLGTKV